MAKTHSFPETDVMIATSGRDDKVARYEGLRRFGPLACWALAENRFFLSVVRIQMDRGHVVCDSGPYRIVRHPGYAGNILPLLGIVLAFGSVWTLIPAAVALIITVIRTVLEDQTLQEELSGYREYARRVRYRLIPGIY